MKKQNLKDEKNTKDEAVEFAPPPGSRRMVRLSKKESFMPSLTKSAGSFLVEVIKVVLIALAIIIPIRYFLIQPFYVKGASMEPTFYDNEYLIIDEISYRLADPKRGDVVVLRNPSNLSEFFIKRIVALPGEKLEITNGDIFIYNSNYPQGALLDESRYLSASIKTSGNEIVILKNNEYFVMGDNRSASLDSRSFGPIDRKEIIGKAWVRAWPFGRLKHFITPQYNY